MRQISRNLVVFMSASPCTSNYETGSYVVRVKVMNFSLLSSNDVKADEVLQITQVSVSVWKDDAVHKSSRADDDDYEKLAL